MRKISPCWNVLLNLLNFANIVRSIWSAFPKYLIKKKSKNLHPRLVLSFFVPQRKNKKLVDMRKHFYKDKSSQMNDIECKNWLWVHFSYQFGLSPLRVANLYQNRQYSKNRKIFNKENILTIKVKVISIFLSQINTTFILRIDIKIWLNLLWNHTTNDNVQWIEYIVSSLQDQFVHMPSQKEVNPHEFIIAFIVSELLDML